MAKEKFKLNNLLRPPRYYNTRDFGRVVVYEDGTIHVVVSPTGRHIKVLDKSVK